MPVTKEQVDEARSLYEEFPEDGRLAELAVELHDQYEQEGAQRREGVAGLFRDRVTHGLSGEQLEQLNQVHQGDVTAKYRNFNDAFFREFIGVNDDQLKSNGVGLRRAYSKQIWGEEVVDDFQFYDRVANDMAFGEEIGKRAMQTALAGKRNIDALGEMAKEFANDKTFQSRKKAWQDQFLEQSSQAQSKMSPYMPLMRDVAAQLQSKMGVAEGATVEDGSYREIVRSIMEVPKEDRKLVIAGIAAMGATDGSGNPLTKLAESFGRGVEDYFENIPAFAGRDYAINVKNALRAGVQVPAEIVGDPKAVMEYTMNRVSETMLQGEFDYTGATGTESGEVVSTSDDVKAEALKLADELIDAIDLRGELRTVAEQNIDPITSDWIAMRGLYAASRSIPYTIASLSKIGIALNAVTMAEMAYQQLGRNNPDMTAEQKQGISIIAGPLMAATEVMSAKILTGQLPFLNRFVNQVTLTGKSRLARYGTRALGASVLELGQENVQDLTPDMVQGVFSALSQDVPGVNWEARFGELARNQGEIFFAVLPLALIGAGVGTWQDYRGAKLLVSDYDLLVTAGVSEADASEIRAKAIAGDMESAQTLLRKSFAKTGGDQTAVAAQIREAAPKFREKIEEADRLRKIGGDLDILPKILSFEGKTVLQFQGGEAVEFDTHAEAMERWGAVASSSVARLHQDLITSVRRTTRNMESGREFRFVQSPLNPTLRDMQQEGTASEKQVEERGEIEDADQEFLKQFQTAEVLSQVGASSEEDALAAQTVLGSSDNVEVNRGKYGERVIQTTVRLFQQGTPLTVFEESAEGDAKVMIRNGQRQWLAENLFAIDQRMKAGLFRSKVKSVDDVTNQDIVEAYSKMVVGYYVGRDGMSEMSPKFQKLFQSEVQKAFNGVMTGYAGLFGSIMKRAEMVEKARLGGDLGAIEEFLAKSIGVTEQGQFERTVIKEGEGIAKDMGVEFLDEQTFSTMSPVPVERIQALMQRIDSMYEAGQTEGVADLEAELEILLERAESDLDGMDEGDDSEQTFLPYKGAPVISRDEEEDPTFPESELVTLWYEWTGKIRSSRGMVDELRETYGTFGAYAKNHTGGEYGSWAIQEGITDEQIEDAAKEAAEIYERRRTAMLRSRVENVTFSTMRLSEQDRRYLELAKDPEANREELQSMVDEAARAAGYDVRAYHGTSDYGFTVFDASKLGKKTGAASAKKAFFFSSRRDVAESYTYLGEGNLFADLQSQFDELSREMDRLMAESVNRDLDNLDDLSAAYNKASSERDEVAKKLHFARMARGAVIDAGGVPEKAPGSGVYSVFLRIDSPLEIDFKGQAKRPETFADLIERAESVGLDSVIIRNAQDNATSDAAGLVSDIFAIIPDSGGLLLKSGSARIKSADPVTYDEQGNVIPLSQRFDQTRDEITFSTISDFSNSRAVPADADTVTVLPDGARLVGPTTFSIMSWHGTPHKIDPREGFRMDKIGTGDGSQAFGWGLYTAEDQRVAVGYQKGLAKWTLDGRDVAELRKKFPSSNMQLAISEEIDIETASERFQKMRPEIEALNAIIDYADNAEFMARSSDAKQLIREWTDSGRLKNQGNLYKIEIQAELDEFLEWDRPLSEQSEKVKAALSPLLPNHKPNFTATPTHPTADGVKMWDVKADGRFLGNFPATSEIAAIAKGIRAAKEQEGQTGNKPIAGAVNPTISGAAIYHAIEGAPKEVSEKLASLGIPGIRFLDGNSRSDGEGTYNYVIFDPAIAKFIEENGQPVDGGTTFSTVAADKPLTKAEQLAEDVAAMSADEVRAELESARLTPNREMVAMLGSFPQYLNPVIDYIMGKRQEMLSGNTSVRDVAKAYWITVASIGADAIDVPTIRRKADTIGLDFNPPEMFLSKGAKGQWQMRPEELAAWWLGTPDGQNALNKIEKGEFDAKDWESGLVLRDAFGKNGLRDKVTKKGSYVPGAVGTPKKGQFNLQNLTGATEAIRKAKGDPKKLETALKKFNGIGEGKKGFVGHMLGFGGWATLDAVELNLWLTGAGETTYASDEAKRIAAIAKRASGSKAESADLFGRIRKRISGLRNVATGAKAIPEEVAAHIIHHWIWDAGKGIETTHEGVYHAMRTFSVMVQGSNEIANSKKIPGLLPKTVLGRPFLPIMADLIGAGQGFGVPLQGGPAWPLLTYNQKTPKKQTAVWASTEKGVKIILSTLSRTNAIFLDGKGKRKAIVGVYTMSQVAHTSNASFQKVVFNAIESSINSGELSKKQELQLSDLVRHKAKTTKQGTENLRNFPTQFSASQFDQYITSLSFDERKFVINVLDSAQAEKIGIPSVARVIEKTRDPSFFGSELVSIVSFLEVDVDALEKGLATKTLTAAKFKVPVHLSYDTMVPGRIITHLRTPIPFELAAKKMSDAFKKEYPTSRTDYLLAGKFHSGIPLPVLDSATVTLVNQAQSLPISQAEVRAMSTAILDEWTVLDDSNSKGAVEFIRAIRNNDAGETLTNYTEPDIRKWLKAGHLKIFKLGEFDVWFALKFGILSDDEKSITDNGDRELVGVTSNVPLKGMSNLIMAKALQEGANKLGCFSVKSDKFPEGFLPSLYEKHGWRQTGSVPYDPLYKDEGSTVTDQELLEKDKKRRESWEKTGWNESRHGMPDVVFMEHEGFPSRTTGQDSGNDASGVAGESVQGTGTEPEEVAKGRLYDDFALLHGGASEGDAGDGRRLLPRGYDRLRGFVKGASPDSLRVTGLDESRRDQLLHAFSSGETYSVIRSTGDIDTRFASMFSPFVRSPELRPKLGEMARERGAKVLREVLPYILQSKRSGASIDREARSIEAFEYDRLLRETFGANSPEEQDALPPVDRQAARSEAQSLAEKWKAQKMREKKKAPKEVMVGHLRTLDAILRALPAEVRGKIGGFVAIAKLTDPDAMLDEIEARVKKIDIEVEKWLRKEAETRRKKLFKQAQPVRDAAGKAPKGKAGADIHDLFRKLKEAMLWDGDTAETWAVGLEDRIASGELSPEEEAHAQIEANLVRLFADWGDTYEDSGKTDKNGRPIKVLTKRGADAARRTAAVDAAEEVFRVGYLREKERVARERELREQDRADIISDVGGAGTRKRRAATEAEDATQKGRAREWLRDLFGFAQVVGEAVGDKSKWKNWFADRERVASNQKEDEIQQVNDDLEKFFADLAGGSILDGEKLLWRMSQRSMDTSAGPMAELEAISAIMMWRQEDGRRHMKGKRDGKGNVISTWSYDQGFVDLLESQLSKEGVAVLDFLTVQYAGEWETLNPVFRELNGINLPKHHFYSPISVKPQQVKQGQMLDPNTGTSMSTGSMTPGSLRTRSQTVAEPDFRNAIEVYIGHKKQLAHWKAYAKFSKEAQARLGNREVRNAIEAKEGQEAAKVLQGWLDYFAQGGTRDAAAHYAINKGINRIYGRAASMALVGRIGTLAVQVTQLAAATAKMPVGSYITRLGKLLSGNLAWGDALNSEYMQRRIRQMPASLQVAMDGLRASKPNAVKHAVREIGKLLSGTDGLFTAGTYAIIYDYQFKRMREAGLDIDTAREEARMETERTMDEIAQPTRPGTRSIKEVTTTDPLAKVVWAFASEPRKNLALLFYSAFNREGKDGARAALYVLGLNAVISSLVRSVWRDMRDDDDEEFFDERNWGPRKVMLAMATDWMAGIPLVGEEVQNALFRLSGEYVPEGTLLSAIGQAPGSFIDLLPGGDAADSKDLEMVLMAMGLKSDTIAAAASLMHIYRDLEGLTRNLID